MSKSQKQRERLISLLKELFQLDQPDLDFGFYRIMHAKAGQVTKFLEDDLLGIIREAFGEVDEARIAEARATYEAARKHAVDYGAPDPDTTEPVKKAKAAWDAAKDSGSNEGDVYDHLYRFFERYYDNGDFMSRRYFARETDGKAAPYAVPYDGREVYLHWANRDQYYIKTSEYLSNFTFDPTQAKEFKERHGGLFKNKPIKVNCRILSASEGEYNNVKATEQTERFFIIHDAEPVKLEMGITGSAELVIQFQYRADPEKTGKEGPWRKKRLAEAAVKVKELLSGLEGASDYVTALMTPAPTESVKDRTLLEKYLAQYTARNTMDYFIHKDLGGFLRRELDFYIKNEVMRLDDIESADAPRVETYLAKVKVLRRIAQHLIDFLAQLEDFQKKLWLKKKFVVDTQYCITIDRIPEEFYPEIAANETQRQEWVELFAIDKFEGYSEPLLVDFLKENTSLPLDTGSFNESFKENVLAEIQLLTNEKTGTLVHSENFQALRALSATLRSSVDCIYIDPPYNTDASSIVYKNNYKDSSWISLMENRLREAQRLMRGSSVIAVAIDDIEFSRLRQLMEDKFGQENMLGVAVVRSNPSGRSTPNGFSEAHDYTLFAGASELASVGRMPRTEKQIARYAESDEIGAFEWVNFRKHGGVEASRQARPKMFYPIYVSGDSIRLPEMSWNAEVQAWDVLEKLGTEEVAVLPISADGTERRWKWGIESVRADYSNFYAKKRSIWPSWRLYEGPRESGRHDARYVVGQKGILGDAVRH
ncbi:DNA methyltransferase [Sneathiella litorea]|uniref:site-specific DNA-methyltransferase (adenine-specific) n=1 Tax=Sneathiella litorea TaxID=2606216 RepID=A0A6L8WAE0_9PROT|nr:DNA methyltransferase [Sneathiella litorea]MZR31462.1 hypothetical protein [Sneathiella litorea]